jgi:Na+/H+-dicarboxylate symporter
VAIAVGLLSTRIKPLADLLEKGVTAIEYLGQYIQPLIPVFMFAVGVYVQSLPASLEREIGLEGALTRFETLNILGLHLDPNTTTGMVTTYVVGSLLVAVACFIWHFAILALAKYKSPRFSLVDYFKNYWVKMYPLLWATSSETLATPLNLYILSTRCPWVRPTVRRIVIGAGSVLCTNGTLICVIVLTGLVGAVLGLEFSLLELMLVIPIAFLISFGIPGIPGELLLFAGPISLVLGIPPEVTPLFLALYLGLQIGLPDSFRTGGNTTNNYVYAIILNETYIGKFMAEEPEPQPA